MSTITDWTVIDNDIVEAIIRTEAKRVAHQYSGVIEEADLRQEAYIICALNPSTVNGYIGLGDAGYLSKWLWSRLTDVARKYAVAANHEVAYEFVDGE